jgi:hypothetical protein
VVRRPSSDQLWEDGQVNTIPLFRYSFPISVDLCDPCIKKLSQKMTQRSQRYAEGRREILALDFRLQFCTVCECVRSHSFGIEK